MKPSDKIILDSLRKGECSHISEVQWLLVEKAVTDAGDVRSVTGMAQTIIFNAIRKGRFSSRSEAGRYAANMRWKGQGERTTGTSGGQGNAKGKIDNAFLRQIFTEEETLSEKYRLDGEGMTAGDAQSLASAAMFRKYGTDSLKALSDAPFSVQESFTDPSSQEFGTRTYDFSPRDYKMVRDAVPQISADDAKKLTQYLLDNNAFGDTSEMSNEEMGREFRMYLDEALGGGSSDDQGSMPDNAEDKAYERMGVSGRKINTRKLSADDREELNQTAGIGRGELIDSLLDANPGAEVGAKAPKTPKATDVDARTATKIKDGNISDLSRIISRDLQSQGKEVPYNLVPYLDALRQMDSADDVYGVESGKSIIAYALSNMTSYKGPTARAVKAELKSRMKASKAPQIPASQFGLDDPTGTMDTVRAQDRMRSRGIDAQNALFQD